jgi:uncharacterized protein Veg
MKLSGKVITHSSFVVSLFGKLFKKKCIIWSPLPSPHYNIFTENNKRINRIKWIELEHKFWPNVTHFYRQILKILKVMFFTDGRQKKWNCQGKLLHTHPLLFLYLWDKKNSHKRNFQYFENLTVKVCNIWCNDVYLYILCCDISWWKLIDRMVLIRFFNTRIASRGVLLTPDGNTIFGRF